MYVLHVGVVNVLGDRNPEDSEELQSWWQTRENTQETPVVASVPKVSTQFYTVEEKESSSNVPA